MFSNVRWRIALWFIALSTAAYIIPTLLALGLFYVNLTASIDAELNGFLASFGHAIDIVEGKPFLKDWARVVQTNPSHSLVSYQLFDKDGHIIESHFPPGIPVLFKTEHEVTANGVTLRTRMTQLTEAHNVVGYFQVQLPTKSRDDAVRELAELTAIFAPLVLLGLGWSSYLVSEKAAVQIRKTLALLRQFIADASHELYTPLSIIQAANESLTKVIDADQPGASELEASQSAAERMEKMLEDLTLLASMETPEQPVDYTSIDLCSLVSAVIDEFRPKFEQKPIYISLELHGETKIRGSRPALERMFANILENAYKYTEANGSVQIKISEDANQSCVSISDSGIGIARENLPNIFERFYRVDKSRTRSSGGSGLGLSIAQAIAHAHGGSIEVSSQLGKGSTFRAILPIE